MKAHLLFKYFVEKCLAIPTSPFFPLVSILVSTTPYLPYIDGRYRVSVGGEELKWHQLAPSANEPAKGLILVHTVQQKPIIKAHFSERIVSNGIIDIKFDSVHYEKTRLKKLIMIIIIITNKSQEMTVFSGRQNLTSAMKLRPEK